MPASLAKYRKFLVALGGLATEAINAGVVHGTAQHEVSIIAAAIAAILVYWVPNASAQPAGASVPGNSTPPAA